MRSSTEFNIRFDASTTSVDAIQRAAYRMCDRLSVDIRVDDLLEVEVHAAAGEDLGELARELRNEVLDQVLRERIRLETAEARNLILALAFSQTGVLPEA